VPVDDNVADILFPICPLLPIPETITCPVDLLIILIASHRASERLASNDLSIRLIPLISVLIIDLAFSIILVLLIILLAF